MNLTSNQKIKKGFLKRKPLVVVYAEREGFEPPDL